MTRDANAEPKNLDPQPFTTPGRPRMTTETPEPRPFAGRASSAVVATLSEYGGFDDWWDGLLTTTQQLIRSNLADAIAAQLEQPAGSTRRQEYDVDEMIRGTAATAAAFALANPTVRLEDMTPDALGDVIVATASVVEDYVRRGKR